MKFQLRINQVHYALILIVLSLFSACTYDKAPVPVFPTGFPSEVDAIMSTKCALPGCHTAQSKDAAAGLDLSSWDKLFEGGRNGSAVIPFRPDFSLIVYYTNHDSILPYLQLLPTMPVNSTPLSASELQSLVNWVNQGSPNKDGVIKFAENPNARKFYVACQGCDEIAVFDANTKLACRYVHAGVSPITESPHMVRVAPNNKFYCISFLASNFFQKFSVSDNLLLGQTDIGPGSWNTFAISSDSKKAYAVDFNAGNIAFINLETMTNQIMNFGFNLPHGSALNSTDDTLYVTMQLGSGIWKIPINDPTGFEQIFFAGGQHQIHEISFSPDGTKYFLTGQNTNSILAINTANDSLLAIIPVGAFPQEMDVSVSHPYLFVSCMEDQATFPGKTGSIFIIDYNTLQVVDEVYTGHQPHGIAVDELNNCVYITNRNISAGGPAPHHSSVCNGRNGYITAINLSTLQIIQGFKAEVSVDPYGIDIMH